MIPVIGTWQADSSQQSLLHIENFQKIVDSI